MESILFPLLKGASLGLIIAIPSTGQTVLCIQEALNRGFIYGLISGLGVAVADTLFSVAAGFGIQTIRVWIESYDRIMHISGAIFILIFGIILFVSKSGGQINTTSSIHSRWNVVSAFMPNFLLTALHPVTLLFFTAAFAAMPIENATVHSATILLIGAGVFLGSMIWWGGLSLGIAVFLKDKMTARFLIRLQKIFGCLLGLLGLGLLLKYLVFV